MIQSSLVHFMQQEFHQLSRKLTYITIAVVCAWALLAWWLGVEVKGNMATGIGAIFIVLAAFTLKIPYMTYWYMLKKYKNEPEKRSALGPNWQDFRDSAMRRRLN